MTTPTPNALLGLDRACPRCHQPAGQRCTSATGRVLKTTHDPRARAAIHAEPVRAWFKDRMSWRSA